MVGAGLRGKQRACWKLGRLTDHDVVGVLRQKSGFSRHGEDSFLRSFVERERKSGLQLQPNSEQLSNRARDRLCAGEHRRHCELGWAAMYAGFPTPKSGPLLPGGGDGRMPLGGPGPPPFPPSHAACEHWEVTGRVFDTRRTAERVGVGRSDLEEEVLLENAGVQCQIQIQSCTETNAADV